MDNNITRHSFIFCIEVLRLVKYLTVFIFSLWGLWGCSSADPRAPVLDLTLSQNRNSTYSQSASPLQNFSTYKVATGDTLYSIAWRSDLDVETLVKRNHLKPPYTIYQGQILNLIEKKPRKLNKAKTTTVKNDLPSQKSDKKAATNCSGQSCEKNRNQKLVQKKTKAYSTNEGVVRTLNKRAAEKHPKRLKVTDWRWPAEGRLTETFSASQQGMKGISLSNRRGTAIHATASGKVVYAGNGLRGYGNLIIIKHNYDYLSAYAHNEKLFVGENETIKEGQKIAIMGDSGADSVHLHFEIRYRGKSVDPLRYLPKR
nr:peptidoglycan DD-metalloendopeptidase family protein [Psychromonas antarctica]